MPKNKNVIEVRNLTVGYDSRIIMQNLDFEVKRGEIFCVMVGSGCGKSTLLKHMIGLYKPMAGDISIFGRSINKVGEEERRSLMRHFGVTYQGGALFGSMTVAENVAMPLQEYTRLKPDEIAEVVHEKLCQVDLGNYGSYMPSELSGGMRKRAGLARALALNPELLFFDEPSAGLDPITSADLDRLILRLRESANTTIVVITHELDSVFTIADRIIMLDKETKGAAAIGDPGYLREHAQCQWVRDFLNRKGCKRQDVK